MNALSDMLLLKALDSSNSPVTITDAQLLDNPIIYCNEAFVQLSGYDRNEIIGRNCRFLQGEHTDRVKVNELRDAIAHKQSTTVTILNFTKNGRAFWNDLQISPVLDDDGTVTHFMGFQNDISERLEKERVLLLTQKLENEIELADSQENKLLKLHKIRKDFTLTAQRQVTDPLQDLSLKLTSLLDDCQECLDDQQVKELKAIADTSQSITDSLTGLLKSAEKASEKVISPSSNT